MLKALRRSLVNIIPITSVFCQGLASYCYQGSKSENCQGKNSIMAAVQLKDKHSLSNYHALRSVALALDLHVDFKKQILSGWAVIDAVAVIEGVHNLVLDTKDLEIQEVTCNNLSLGFELGETVGRLGKPLHINLPTALSINEKVSVAIKYSTTPEAYALQWLSPEQTRGKVHPFLFTQCESIHARTFYPCQDSPAAKVTYKATIHTPKPLVALMSALSTGSEVSEDGKDFVAYHFMQDVPVPTYLVTLAVGDLHSRELGKRCRVWAEEVTVEEAATEFSDTEEFLEIAEDICGPFVWKRYDLLVLPPSFPYGGMENPMLTFVTPTLLAGDKSMVNVIAHEIAHSWTGNLVTMETWEHFWMNEGFTMFVERRICERKYGRSYAHFTVLQAKYDLQEDVNLFGPESDLTSLSPDLTHTHPDDAFSVVPYEKGFFFLTYLETLMGGPEVFEPYLRSHLDRFKYITVTTQQWQQYFIEYFTTLGMQDKIKEIDFDMWLKAPGMPPMPTNLDLSLEVACDALAERWTKAEVADLSVFKKDDIKDFDALQIVVFLKKLMDSGKLTSAHGEALDLAYGFSQRRNADIRLGWMTLALSINYQKVFPNVV
eukprot:Ihof_evm2s14 gene=Ihof_evmTU2s14